MKNYIVEKQFEHNGLMCVVTFSTMGIRCGYVGIPKSHPLYGKDYTDHLDIKKEDIDKPISGTFALFSAIFDTDERIRIDAYFTCHGGITYSDGGDNSTYPIESNLWWFGFDCGHYGDAEDLDLAYDLFPEYREQIIQDKALEEKYPIEGTIRDLEYVTENCIELADQLNKFR